MNIAAELAANPAAPNGPAVSSLTGSIRVNLRYNRDHISAVEIYNSRPFAVTRLFQDKPPERVLAMIPSLFYICGMGQLIASVRAFESVYGQIELPATRQARDALIFAESLREQVFSWVTHWAPQHKSKLSPVVDWFNQCRKQLGWCLTLQAAAPDSAVCQADLERLAGQLAQVLQPFLPTHGYFQTLSEMGISEQVYQLLSQYGECQVGFAAKALHLPEQQEYSSVIAVLSGSDAEQYCHQPAVDGVPRETGCWARQQVGAKGFVLESRLRALHREIISAVERFKTLNQTGGMPKVEPHGPSGCAIVETARGTLLHKVKLDEQGNVASYQIIAPTEWNFHPHGSLKTLLEGLYLPWDQVTPVAETLIKLLDPCVPWQLELTHA